MGTLVYLQTFHRHPIKISPSPCLARLNADLCGSRFKVRQMHKDSSVPAARGIFKLLDLNACARARTHTQTHSKRAHVCKVCVFLPEAKMHCTWETLAMPLLAEDTILLFFSQHLSHLSHFRAGLGVGEFTVILSAYLYMVCGMCSIPVRYYISLYQGIVDPRRCVLPP